VKSRWWWCRTSCNGLV